jgi:hypothetical protein
MWRRRWFHRTEHWQHEQHEQHKQHANSAGGIHHAELSGKTIYTTTPSNTGTIDAITFNADGTVTDSLNMTTTSTSSASITLSGTYTINGSGCSQLRSPARTPFRLGRPRLPRTATTHSQRGHQLQPDLEKWYYDQSIGSIQALACATGATIPVTSTTTTSGPTGLSASQQTSTTVSLTWVAPSAGTNNIANYIIYRNGTQVGTSSTTTYTDTNLTPSTTYSYTVAASLQSSGVSATSTAINATTSAASTTPSLITLISNTTVSGRYQKF